MPIQSTNTTQALNLSGSFWVIAPEVSVAVTGPSAVFDSGGSFLINDGYISCTYAGVSLASMGSEVVNSADASITGSIGINLSGLDQTATNFGSVWASEEGVRFEHSSQHSALDNRGFIYSSGIGVFDWSSLGGNWITNSGTIEGKSDGIDLEQLSGLFSTVVNSGTIAGGVWAIEGAFGGLHLTNTGTLIGGINMGSFNPAADLVINSGRINGAVNLGGGNDIYNGSGGTASGRIDGGAGNDTLTGGTGKDQFLFDTALGPNNIDRINGFHHGIDKIDLSHAIFPAGVTLGTLKAAAFLEGTTAHELSATRIVYNPANGYVYYDADGSGHAHAPIHFATLAASLTLANTDFTIVA
jgi:Ca2+-binding RTX toxin-like protein